MKKFLYIAGAVIGILIVAAIAVPLAVPTGTWKAEIEQRVTAATGRKLTIAGPVHLSLLPAIAVIANDVTLANPPGAKDAAMASFGKLEVRVRVLPLLSGKLAIDRFVIDKPVIHLEVNAQGKANWDFSTATTPPQTQASSAGQSSGTSVPNGLELGDIRLSNGTVTYDDARANKHYALSAVNATLFLPSLDGPFKADGSLVWNNKKVSVTGEITQPDAAMSGKGSTVGFTVDADPVKLKFGGKVSGKEPARLDGNLQLDVPNVRDLVKWTGIKADLPGTGFGPLSIKGTLALQGSRYSFTDAAYKLDAIEANGDLAVDTGGKVPYAKATLTTGMLDLNPYLPEPKSAANDNKAPTNAPVTPAERASRGWSTQPIDLSPLKLANADLSLTVAGLRYHALNAGKSVLNVSLKDGRLAADMPQLALYAGTGKSHLNVDAASPKPALAITANLANIDIYPLLKDAIGLESISGKATGDISLNTSGVSQRDLISALNGKGSVRVKDGSVSGLDIGAMITNIGSAFSAAGSGKEQQTGFSDASATFIIANGIARNDDLAMAAPLFRIAGKGTVDMPKRTINYRIEPKLVPDPRGEGGWKNAIGIGVPVDISGPWDKIKYQPDLAGLLPDAQNTLRGLRDIFRGDSSSGSNGGSGSSPSQPSQPSQNPLDQLKSLFGR